MVVEFFKTIREANEFASQYNPKYTTVEVWGLDKPGMICAFISEKNDALARERTDVKGARALVAIYR